ncbi:peroxiredoxin family protein [Sphingobacterium athyrii]|uniref:Thioredoxin domain-containing protein n=1 Tax=Sphingobacterium athyrii TaxID=2152717 RepID=A0A363NUB3_9SPHI|nr:TlpA disulfide reductase family protein [Sphingobacterium athyrii]PUV24406.1 hypothetical protein DCO56_13760 [Sphingobacterium athyrii]
MKSHIIFIIFLNLVAITGFTQKLTKVSGYIPESKDSSILVQLIINDPKVIKIDSQTLLEAKTEQGLFSFDFVINSPSMIVVKANGRNILFPGVYNLLIEPGDSLNLNISSLKKLGLLNIEVTGDGKEKIDFLKEIIKPLVPIYKTDPHYQSLQFRFETTDRKLNCIDSVYRSFKGKISQHAKDILRAYQYHYTLDIPLLGITRNKSDSVRYFFDKYIILKKRMNVLLNPQVINYFPSHVLYNYVYLASFINPAQQTGINFIKNSPIDFAHLIIKNFDKNSAIKEYVLADLTLSNLARNMLNDNAKDLYNLYVENVSTQSVFFQEVQNLYNYNASNLSPGSPFFKFELPDSSGRVHKLNDYKGKVIVLDFWFYGCVGCAQITKALDLLETRFDRNKVEFISVNIDTRKTWLAGIGKFTSLNSTHLYTDEQRGTHPLIKYLNFTTYPKLVVIDQNGKMVGSPPDPRSKAEEFVRFINSL